MKLIITTCWIRLRIEPNFVWQDIQLKSLVLARFFVKLTISRKFCWDFNKLSEDFSVFDMVKLVDGGKDWILVLTSFFKRPVPVPVVIWFDEFFTFKIMNFLLSGIMFSFFTNFECSSGFKLLEKREYYVLGPYHLLML